MYPFDLTSDNQLDAINVKENVYICERYMKAKTSTTTTTTTLALTSALLIE